MSGREVTIPAGEGAGRPAFLVLPESMEPPLPGLLLLHEILGLNGDIRRIAQRLAAAGYAVLAPDLFAGEGARTLCVMRTMRSLGRSHSPVLDAIESARGWLAERPEVDAARLGVVGFCMGGGFALLHAVRAPVGAAATFYGDVPKRAEDLAGVCPVVAGYGGRDRPFAGQGRRLEQLLSELDVEHDVRVYPDAGHSYMNQNEGILARIGAVSPMRVGYDEEAAEDSWRRMLAFFQRHLGGSAAGA